MNIEICPLEKIVIGSASIYLGMTQSEVESVLGKGQFIGSRYYYFNNELALDYNGGRLDFVEFLSGADGALRPKIYNVSVFETKADDLFDILKKQNNGPVNDSEHGYSYQFPNISVGVYREAVPEDVNEMIEEAKSFGNPMSDDEIEYEMKRANYWATIGCGSVGYYQR